MQAVRVHQRIYLRAARGRHAGDDQVLVRREAEIAFVHAGDFAQAGEVRAIGAVLDAARQQPQRQVPAAVVAFNPAEAVAAVVEGEGPRRREREAGAAFHLLREPIQPAVVDRVLQARALAHGAVAKVALGGDHGGGHGDHLVGRDEADDVGQARIGFGIAMGGAHAAADADVVAGQFAAFEHGDEAQVLGEHVHVVHRRDGEADLELARQVGAAVDGFVLAAAAGHALFVQPDFVVGAGVGQQVFGQRGGLRVNQRVRPRLQRIGRHRHVAVDVAAGGQRVHQLRVDGLHGGLELALDDAVELERLARGDAQAALGVGGGDGVQAQPLRRRDHAAGRAGADHEAVVGLEPGLAALVAQVAVVLLVAAVVLDQHLVGVGQRTGDGVGQALQQRAAQAAASGLDVFDGMGGHQYTSRA